ncbi:choline dehydrogenase [Emiliania huxleyi CCMP1516]|uniref:Glucose-methanol-choline oxidoreductase N-terminal domain-containing protein n=2 Tax=Emiliania huxleyi TaxID=2903 RepID=A0A0D3JH79_EMIH1|nr:choline dehydrogenase [Emiliania huxleyi CCMP1516]EOD22864.1 choline dehydrogenase [Emiliania huxleyi CCMP1516]|eukprot:XP_005775293.1 choline dehydrogenase [Emiliania huxleyi CCMP1516]
MGACLGKHQAVNDDKSGGGKRYIVVGSGAAGSPLAAKLARAGCTVTLLELGPDDDWHGDAAPGVPLDLFNPEFSWKLQNLYAPAAVQSVVWSEPTWTVPRDWAEQVRQLNEGGHSHFAGPGPEPHSEYNHNANVLGGNTVHNLGFWVRGALSQYAEWGPAWEEAAVRGAFEEVEAAYSTRGLYGKLFNAKTAGMDSSVDDAVMERFRAAGFAPDRARDLGEAGERGSVAWSEWTISAAGRRMSSGSVFVDPVKGLPNFTLRTHAKVTRVRFEGGRAVGVAYTDTTTGEECLLDADEVILSAGALATAGLLLASGVGPAVDLAALEIPLVADLPVGQELQTRAKVGVLHTFHGESAFPAMGKPAPTSYMRTQPNIWAMIRSPLADAEGPDAIADLVIWANSNTDETTCPEPGQTAVAFNVSAMLPKSRGSVTLAPDGSGGHRVVWRPNFLADGHASAVMSYGIGPRIKLVRDMLASDPQKRFSQLEPAGTAADEAHIAAKATTFWHDSCTAPIGRVVDQDLRVMGLQGLRVADTSVCPRISNAPPSPMAHVVGILGASIILRGEKAELLKADT